MFILNIEQLNNKNLYKCDEYESNRLIREGFPLLGIHEDIYYFSLTEDLYNFLHLKGGV